MSRYYGDMVTFVESRVYGDIRGIKSRAGCASNQTANNGAVPAIKLPIMVLTISVLSTLMITAPALAYVTGGPKKWICNPIIHSVL